MSPTINIQPWQTLDDWAKVGAVLLTESAMLKCVWTYWLQPVVCSMGVLNTWAGARCWEPDRSEGRISSIQIPISFSRQKREIERCLRESSSCLPERSSLWTVSMVIAVSSYVLFNVHTLERNQVMCMSRTLCLCETSQHYLILS